MTQKLEQLARFEKWQADRKLDIDDYNFLLEIMHNMYFTGRNDQIINSHLHRKTNEYQICKQG